MSWVEFLGGFVSGWGLHALRFWWTEKRKRQREQAAWDRLCEEMPDLIRDLKAVWKKPEFAGQRRIAVTPQRAQKITDLPGETKVGVNDNDYPGLLGKLSTLKEAGMIEIIQDDGRCAVIEFQEAFIKRLRDGKKN